MRKVAIKNGLHGFVVNGFDFSGISPAKYQEMLTEIAAPNYQPMKGWLAVGRGSKPWTIAVRGASGGAREVIDCQTMYSVANFGHGNEEILWTITEYVNNIWAPTGNGLTNNIQLPAFTALRKFTGLDARVITKSGGGEAVETALKAARRLWWARHGKPTEEELPQGPKIVAAQHAFHGRTLGATSLFEIGDSSRKGFGPFPNSTVWVPFNDIGALEEAFRKHTDIAGVLLEPIQGECGIIVPDDDYLPRVRKLCHDHGALFMLDEVQTGFGRTGKNFAFEHSEAEPDILILGKALGGGVLPVSAIMGTKHAGFRGDRGDYDVLSYLAADGPGEEGSTWSGAALACVAILAAIKELSDGNLANLAAKNGARFMGELQELQTKNPDLITDVRGKGLMVGVDFTLPGRELSHALLREGVWAHYTGKQEKKTLRFLPPLGTPPEVLSDVVLRLECALSKLKT